MPLKTEPVDVFLDGINKFLTLLGRIGVIEAQVTETLVFLRQGEIEANGFGVPDMQIAVWLWRKPGVHATAMLPGLEVLVDHMANEVGWRCRRALVGRIGSRHEMNL